MSQKVAIITGGSHGIGFETTKKLVERGVYCIIASRNIANINEAIQKIKTDTGKDNLVGMKLDLCDFDSVRRFATDFKAKNLPLHILINNAGVISKNKTTAACGLETTFVANHLGHFLLTNLLLDKLKASAPSRVVVVASRMEDPTKGVGSKTMLDLNTFNFDTISYDTTAAYRYSKLANILFTYHLARMVEGDGVLVNCLEPGFIPATGLSREYAKPLRWIGKHIFGPMFGAKSVDYAGNCVSDAALNPIITKGGQFFDDCKPAQSSERSHNVQEQQQLWDYSARIVGL